MAASAGPEGWGVVIGGGGFRQVGHVQVQRDVGGLNSPRCEMTCGRSGSGGIGSLEGIGERLGITGVLIEIVRIIYGFLIA